MGRSGINLRMVVAFPLVLFPPVIMLAAHLIYVFIYSIEWCFTLLSRICHLYNGAQYYSWRKLGFGLRKPSTIRRLLGGLPTYDWKESQHYLDLNLNQRPQWSDTCGLLKCSGVLTD